ncbi:MAG: polymer-forming cytoskeletal protein [Clostridia bacterium]|nr:polymer-forming cytoskeletal protein [Clostridia bacterium]
MNFKKFKYVSVDVLIGEKTKLTGDLVSESAIKIDGMVKGDITTTREVILTENAQVEGDVRASSLIVAGKLFGNALASDQLLIKETGTLEGDIETGSLVIEEGGVFMGTNRSIKKEISNEVACENEAYDGKEAEK